MMSRPALCWVGLAVWIPVMGCTPAQHEGVTNRTPVVSVVHPVVDAVTEFEDFTGRTEAVYSVEVRARVTGYLVKKFHVDGAEVRKGDLLYELDRRPFEVELLRNEATLLQGETRLKRLEADRRRAVELLGRKAMSREEYDRIIGDYSEAQAAVDLARANLELARLNLEFTRIKAPISGRLSRALPSVGNLITADVTPLITTVSLDPMYIYFDVDERTLLRLRRLVGEGKVKTRREAEVSVLAGLADEEGFPHRGTIDFSDNRVDPSLGTLSVRGILANPEPRVLTPGMFMRIRLPVGKPHEALMIPKKAISTDRGQRYVYVLNDQNEVVPRPVAVGLSSHGLRAIERGLSSAERVVVSGLQRIRPGMRVTIRPAGPLEGPGTPLPISNHEPATSSAPASSE